MFFLLVSLDGYHYDTWHPLFFSFFGKLHYMQFQFWNSFPWWFQNLQLRIARKRMITVSVFWRSSRVVGKSYSVPAITAPASLRSGFAQMASAGILKERLAKQASVVRERLLSTVNGYCLIHVFCMCMLLNMHWEQEQMRNFLLVQWWEQHFLTSGQNTCDGVSIKCHNEHAVRSSNVGKVSDKRSHYSRM